MKLNTVGRPSRWLVLGACVVASASGGCATAGTTGDTTTKAPAPPTLEELAAAIALTNPTSSLVCYDAVTGVPRFVDKRSKDALGGLCEAPAKEPVPPTKAKPPTTTATKTTGGGGGNGDGGNGSGATTTDETPIDPYTGEPVVFWSMCADEGEENWTRQGPDGVPGKKCEFLRSDVPQRHFPYFPPRSLVESESGKDETVTPPVTPPYTPPVTPYTPPI